MKFYIDESGTFSSPTNPNDLSVSLAVGVVLSEQIETDFCRDYKLFVSKLGPNELVDGEPKGTKMTNKNRLRFCQVLDTYAQRGLLLVPAIVDMSIMPKTEGSFNIREFEKLVRELAADETRGDADAKMTSLADSISDLSEVQGWRIHTWANATQLAIKCAVSWLCSEGHEDYWEMLSFEVDPTGSVREQQLFVRLIKTWLSAYSRQVPFEIYDEIHTPQNPFVKKYILDDGLNFDLLLDGNVHFPDSRNSIGIQVADVAANIIKRAARSPQNEDDALDIYARLMTSCPSQYCPGFVWASSDQSEYLNVRTKYDHLFSVFE